MEKVFYSLKELDGRVEEAHNLRNGILMENAGRGAAEKIKAVFPGLQNSFKESDSQKIANKKNKPVMQIICGSGDNGGDGLVIARMLKDYFSVVAVCLKESKSELCKLQKMRLDSIGIKTRKTILANCDILIDAFLGTGLKGELRNDDKKNIEKINKLKCFKIAIDIPSGINGDGIASPIAVKADLTLSMGALKTAFYSDEAKDFVGKIEVIDLGLPRSNYETETNTFLLQKSDMRLPIRKKQNTHKKSFGHCGIVCGEKSGAGLLAASAALKFGAGVVTICGNKPKNMKYDFMYSPKILQKEFTAIAVGSGLGRNSPLFEEIFEVSSIVLSSKTSSAKTELKEMPTVLDADIFYYPQIKEILPKLKKVVLTPHPKEFSELLRICGFGNYGVHDVQKNRFKLLFEFCKKYPQLTVLLKGANTLIGKGEKLYINNLGGSALSKAGSGDVLAGMICALLAQGYTPLDSAITASLAHSIAGNSFEPNYSLTASELVKRVGRY